MKILPKLRIFNSLKKNVQIKLTFIRTLIKKLRLQAKRLANLDVVLVVVGGKVLVAQHVGDRVGALQVVLLLPGVGTVEYCLLVGSRGRHQLTRLLLLLV